MNAAIYARYSTDLQNDRSIEDQIAECLSYADRNKLTVIETYADRARSGSSAVNRDDWQRLMRDADARKFHILIVEDVDRISRDEADYHAFRKRLAFLEIKIHTVHGGEISSMEGSLRAMMSAHYLENLAHKTRRGLAGVVAQGRYPGGRVYGYRSVPGKPGQIEIDEDQALVVRRVYQEYAAGRTPRDIARDLTRENIPSPRGGRWAASTINGNTKRQNGLLQNPLYAGKIVWNRLRMGRDPDNGRRVSRSNPKSAWHEQEAPHLAIIDRELFDTVQERKAERSKGHPTYQRRPKHILSGLLRCGACGGGMSVSGKDKSGRVRLYCTAWRESGSCPAPKTFYLCTVENAVLSKLRNELRHPAVIAEYTRTYTEERSRLAQRITKDRAKLERRLANVESELERAFKAFTRGIVPEDVAEKQMAALEAERETLESKLEATPAAPSVVVLHPAALSRYEGQLSRLQEVLAAGSAAGDIEAAAAIRDIVDTVTVRPDPEHRGSVLIEIVGRLNVLLRDGADSNKQGPLSVGKLVAGARSSLSHRNIPFILLACGRAGNAKQAS